MKIVFATQSEVLVSSISKYILLLRYYNVYESFKLKRVINAFGFKHRREKEKNMNGWCFSPWGQRSAEMLMIKQLQMVCGKMQSILRLR